MNTWMVTNMEHLYGNFSNEQMDKTRKQMHSMVHWLLIYQEQHYDADKLDRYFNTVLLRFSGLNELLHCPEALVELISNLQAARMMVKAPNFQFADYRKLILDSHTLVDRCFGGDMGGSV